MNTLIALLLIIGLISIGFSLGLYVQRKLTERSFRLENEKYALYKNNQFLEVLSNIKFGSSQFKTRINDTVYVSTTLSDYGDIEVIYLIDKNDIAIFQGSKCLNTSDGIDVNIIIEIISVIYTIYDKKINDFVDILGFKFYREEFERSFSVKVDDLKNSNLFRGLSNDNEIDKIKSENQKKFNLDDILDKISSSGIDSLTFEERVFLDNYSNEEGN
jgi:hypothetical protein